MPITASKARSLCSVSEFNLFKWSSAKLAGTLVPSLLKKKIERARKLRDKYRDLAKRQRAEERGKREPKGVRPAQGNERTLEKAQLFAEALERFQAALKKAEAAPAKEPSKKAPSAKGCGRARKSCK